MDNHKEKEFIVRGRIFKTKWRVKGWLLSKISMEFLVNKIAIIPLENPLNLPFKLKIFFFVSMAKWETGKP